jgi:hypothetical protein
MTRQALALEVGLALDRRGVGGRRGGRDVVVLELGLLGFRGRGDEADSSLGAVRRAEQALKRTPGAISTILWVVSSRISFRGAGSSGFSVAPVESALPAANGPLAPSVLTRAGFGLRSIFAGS